MSTPPEYDKYDLNAHMRPILSTEEQVTKEERVQERQRRLMMNDLAEVLNTKAGERLFREMVMSGGVFSEEFTGNSQTYFNQGLRIAALRYYNLACEISDEYKTRLTPPYRDGYPYDLTEPQKPSKA